MHRNDLRSSHLILVTRISGWEALHLPLCAHFGKDEDMSQPPRPFFTVTDFHSLSVTTALRQGDDLTIAKDDHSLPILIALDIAALTGTCWAPRPTSAMSGALKHCFARYPAIR